MKAALLLATALASLAQARSDGLAPLPAPPAVDAAKADLGKRLFYDYRLSGDGTMSCASCHSPQRAYADGRALSEGYPSTRYFRNTPSLFNAAQAKRLFWDGRMPGSDLPTVIRDHISEAHFMNADGRLVIERLRQIPEYESEFKAAMGGEPSYGRILNAVAEYVKTIRSGETAFDLFLGGQKDSLSESAKRGLTLFTGKAGCLRCHHGPLLTDDGLHVSGVPENQEIFDDPLRHITFRRFFKTLGVANYADIRRDPGLYGVSKLAEDRGRFKTPSLREVGRTAPYMHNGVFKTLEEVLEFYSESMSLKLADGEKKDLVEFLGSLSSPERKVRPAALPPYALRKVGEN